METVTIPREEYIRLKMSESKLRKLYERLIEFENNIKEGKLFTRKDLGF